MTVTISKAKWREAYAIIWGIPDDQLNLQSFYTDTATDSHGETARHVVTCRTIACIAGYLVAHPTWSIGVIDTSLSAHNAASDLLNIYEAVFATRSYSIYDRRIPNPWRLVNPTDKELALFRILQQLDWDPTDAWDRVAADTESYQVKHGPKAVCGQSA